MERHVFNTFYDYLNANKFLSQHQSGFRLKHSCETALHNIIGNWLENIDKGKLTGVLFIDLSKIFDTVNHHVQMHKLLSFGICENTFKWFYSYLYERSQCVK
jgi:retron-type reverse transcriptase